MCQPLKKKQVVGAKEYTLPIFTKLDSSMMHFNKPYSPVVVNLISHATPFIGCPFFIIYNLLSLPVR